MGRFSAAFRARAQAGLTPVAVLEFTVGGTTIMVSDGGVISSARGTYAPRIRSWGGAVTHEAYEFYGDIVSPTISAEIDDPDGEITALFTGQYAREVVGSPGAVYLLYEDIDFADWFLYFSGSINENSYAGRKLWRVGFRHDDFALAAETGEVFVQSVNADDFLDIANADPDALGTEIPLIYGKNYAASGAVLCPYVATDGDEVSATNPHRYLVGAGFLQDIDEIFVDGASAVGSPAKDTNWFWTTRNGKSFTEVGFASAQAGPVTVNVHGFTDEGTGSTTLGDLITNKAKQIEHALTNFVFNRWTRGEWFTEGTDSPVDTASITTLAAYFDGIGFVNPVGSNVITRQKSFDFLRNWKTENQVAVWWTEANELRFKVRSPFDTDVYLDGNSPANWPWFNTIEHGRGDKPIFPIGSDGSQQADRITYKAGWTPEAGFTEERHVRDFERSIVSGQTIDAKWAKSEADKAPEYDAPSRRLRRVRFPLKPLELTTSVAFLDEHLLEPLLISDPDAPTADGNGWGLDAIWKPRLHSITKRSLDLGTKTLTCEVEDEVPFRATWWDSGKGENGGGKGIGVALFHFIAASFIRNTRAWVPNTDGTIALVAANNLKRTPDGALLEDGSSNIIGNNAFLDGLTGWTETTPGQITLQTGVKIFTDETADALGGTNQTVNLATVGPTGSSLNRITTTTADGSNACTLSALMRDNSGVVGRVRIQNTTTTNWLVSGSTWQASPVDVTTGWSESGGEWVRNEVTFDMESTTSTLDVHIISPATVGDTDFGHVQFEPPTAHGQTHFATSIMVSGTSSAATRDADVYRVANDSGARVIEYYERGTFRCVWKPLFVKTTAASSAAYFMTVNDAAGSPVILLSVGYNNSAGEFVADWGNGSEAVISHDIVAGEEYKIALTWISDEGELGQSQGDLILDVYDPVGDQWLTDTATGLTQASADATTWMVIGAASMGTGSVLSAYGTMHSIEVLPFVLTQGERRAFP